LFELGALFVLLAAMAPAVQAASNGLGITPRKDYTIKPGQQVSDTLYLDNLSTSQALNVTLKVIDFTAADQTGTPILQLNPNAPIAPWSLKSFTSLPSTVTVPAGKSTNVPFTITIPTRQGPGSYYSAIEYVATGTGGQNQVNIAASSASLIFVTVPGKATENLQLVRFGAFVPNVDTQTSAFASWFFTSPPKSVAYILHNQGNVAEQPTGSIILRNTFGKQVREIDQLNPNSQLALIGQTRLFTVCTHAGQQQVKDATGQMVAETVCENPKLTPGHYTVQLTILYGINGNTTHQITATATFWYLPLWFVAVVLVGLVVIAGIIYVVIRRHRRTHAH